ELNGRDPAAVARAMCKRHEGAGADGLMIYEFGESSVRMQLFNADGSPSEVSGNGIRCLAALAVRERPGTEQVAIDTPAGLKVVELPAPNGDPLTSRASMGEPQNIRQIALKAAGETVLVVVLSVGN